MCNINSLTQKLSPCTSCENVLISLKNWIIAQQKAPTGQITERKCPSEQQRARRRHLDFISSSSQSSHEPSHQSTNFGASCLALCSGCRMEELTSTQIISHVKEDVPVWRGENIRSSKRSPDAVLPFEQTRVIKEIKTVYVNIHV